MAIRAVLLDVDGTLIDSVDAHASAWVEVCAEFGYEVAFDRVRRMIGMGGDRVLPQLTGLKEDSQTGRAMSERRGAIFREQHLPKLQPFEGVRELLQRCVDDGLRLVAASSSNVRDLSLLLKQAGVQDLFHDETSADDADSSKPAPDIIDAALRRAHCTADEAVMIGDTPYDVKAAKRAGVPCIALRCSGWDDENLGDAVAVYDDPADLLSHYETSPLAHPAGARE